MFWHFSREEDTVGPQTLELIIEDRRWKLLSSNKGRGILRKIVSPLCVEGKEPEKKHTKILLGRRLKAVHRQERHEKSFC